jgi:hypothetical protein
VPKKTLKQIAAEKPFNDYANWWPLGPTFAALMAEAIISQWSVLPYNTQVLGVVKGYVVTYLDIVFNQSARVALVNKFVNKSFDSPIQSGEFDALSYAFYRSAFELIAQHPAAYAHSVKKERRLFTRRVGQVFFQQLQKHLQLNLPDKLDTQQKFDQLKEAINQVGAFLKNEGYLRDHFAFLFEVDVEHAGQKIWQRENEVVERLQQGHTAYALYEMGYPVILPSAVYLCHTMGEAQHHSSRIIEELFEQVGYQARETDDFDPIGYPSDRVVELWEIRPLN